MEICDRCRVGELGEGDGELAHDQRGGFGRKKCYKVGIQTSSNLERGGTDRSSNHGTYYLNQLCSLYILLNDSTSAISQLEAFYNSTFLAQIAANGDQPLESSRTRPYHYRAYNLAALVVNAQIGDYFGLSPSGWNRTTSSGATILDAVTYAIAQNADSEPSSLTELNPIVAAVASKFGDPNGSFAAFLAKTDPQYMAQPYYALASGLGGSGLQANATSTSPNPANTNAPPLYVKDNAADHFAAPFSICRAVVTGLAVILGIALAGGILF